MIPLSEGGHGKKISMFFTGGYTESGALVSFLNKINSNVFYDQRCPNKTRRRKGSVLTPLKPDVSGLTGTSLTAYMFDHLEKYKDDLRDYAGVLIEDDLDGKFYSYINDGRKKIIITDRNQDYEEYISGLAHRVREILNKKDDFPVICLHASPEIECWILADWNNSFGNIYGTKGFRVLQNNENDYFANRFRVFVNEFVLKDYRDRLELYGYFNGEYKKLSDEIIHGLDGEFKVNLSEDSKNKLAISIAYNKQLYYSKSLHGDMMLREIMPDEVKKNCNIFFKEAYDQLKLL